MIYTFNHINLDYLKLMSDGDDDMEKTMLEMLLAELPEEFGKMKALYCEKSWVELGNVSHKMKSTMAFVGNPAMTEANREIEHIIKHGGELERIAGLLQTLEDYSPKVMTELQAAFNGQAVNA